MDDLVDVEWLAEHLDEPDLVVLDCSVQMTGTPPALVSVSGRAAFDDGHIPGAGFADLLVDLSDTSQPIGYALPTVEAFCEAMERLGVGDDTRVVLYDTSMSMWAARVWWMLRWAGFDSTALLDGGFGAWVAAGLAVSTDPPTRPRGSLTPRPRPQLIAHRDEVLAAVGDNAVQLVDTLPEPHFRGEMSLYARPGHIPSAVNVSVFDMIDGTGRIDVAADLTASHGGDPASRTITYCGGGIAASLGAFAMTRAGYSDVAVYAASLQEWTADPSLPLATGDI